MAAYSLDDFLTISSVEELEWLPDGSGLVYAAISPLTGVQEIFRVDLADARTRQLTGTCVPKLRTSPLAERAEPKARLAVSRGGHRVFFTSARYYQTMDNIFSIGTDGEDLVQHTFHDAIIETGPAPSPDGMTLAYYDRRPRGTKIQLLDLTAERAWPRLLQPGPDQERVPVWSPNGRHVAFERNGDIWLHDVESTDQRRLVADEWPAVASPAWSPDSSRVAVTCAASGFGQIGVVDVETGQLVPVTREARQHDAPTWSPDGATLAFVRTDGIGLSSQIAVAPADGGAAPLDLTCRRGVRAAPRFAPDGSTIAYLETASNRASDIWLVNADGGEPKQLTHSMGAVDPGQLSVAEETTYRTIDNLPIPTLILKPADFRADTHYPVVVTLHGHPGRWNHTMHVLWQFLVSRGVVIVAPNPRGTVGLGSAFHDLHIGDYCGAEFEDILGCVDFVKTLDFVDPRRIASWGGSGGGNMSLLVATKAPDTFVAQVIRAPVSSWKWLALDRFTGQPRFATAFRDPKLEREEMGGSYADLSERYDERSPLNFVEHARIPQLLMHGQRDSSVPINESRRWVERMRELGKGHLVDYVEYPDEDHSLERYRATTRDMGGRIVAFLATHLNAPQLLDSPATITCEDDR